MTDPVEPRGLPRQAWLDPLVRLSDDQFRIPGTQIRFGLDPILGAVFPVVGDSVSTALACLVVLVAWKEGAPPSLLLRMVGNVAVDALVGSVPLVGDWFDATYRANRKNHTLLRNFQARRDVLPDMGANGTSRHPVTTLKMPAWVLPALIAVMVLLLLIPLSVAVLIGYWIWQ
jgi:hypothetical protein